MTVSLPFNQNATMSDSNLIGTPASYDQKRNLLQLFFSRAKKHPNHPFLFAKHQDRWQNLTYHEVANQVRYLAIALTAQGVVKGDRVMLVSANRPEWVIADLAIMACGAITTPAYITNSQADHAYILKDSEPVGVIYASSEIGKKLLPAIDKANSVKFTISINADTAHLETKRHQKIWTEILAQGAEILANGQPDTAAQWTKQLNRTDTACIIYTSGTGGHPKGVMLSHGAILCNCKGAHCLVEQLGLDDQIFLSFLPLSHSYEHTAGLFFPIGIGAQIYYAESIDKLSSNLLEVRPTLMTAVPRLYENMHSRITTRMTRTGGFKTALFHKAVAIGRKKHINPTSLNFIEWLIDPLLDRLVRTKVKERFGGKLKALISGGAPLNPEIGSFFQALGLTLLQGYGQTEAAPVISCNPPQKVKIHTVGTPLSDVEVRIAEDGEILVRGELVMTGYWRRPEETALTIQEGWLHTGDIGRLDAEHYLEITDRKKDIIVLSGGDNIAPQRIEGALNIQPEIAQTMIYGDKHAYLVALLVPDREWLVGWAAKNGKDDITDLAILAADPDLSAHLGDVVARINNNLSTLERIRNFAIVSQAFTIENNMMTPTLKIRRHVILETYRTMLENLYS